MCGIRKSANTEWSLEAYQRVDASGEVGVAPPSAFGAGRLVDVQPRRSDPEGARKVVGAVLYAVLSLIGALLLLFVFVVPAVLGPKPGTELTAMAIGALMALPPLVIYLWIPWIVDRYDPEPWWCLLLCLVWGGIPACGFSAVINTSASALGHAIGGEGFADALGACVSAPIVEEFFKGLAVFGMFYFLRRQFDGVVDGIVYATFAALGFAAIENIIYYSRAAEADMVTGREGALAATFIVRGVLAPWGHPLYTSMTGLGFGLARESEKEWVRWLAPIGGYCVAVFLHSVWNTAATLSNMLVMLMLPLWFLTVIGFFIIVIWLVARKGKIIRLHLQDEVLMGFLTLQELELVSSPFGRLKASFSFGGATGRRFIDTAARLSLSKWHTGRAHRRQKLTVSADMIVPLRQELMALRHEIARKLGRAVPLPAPFPPGQPLPRWYVKK